MSASSNSEIHNSRLLDASPEMILRAFREPERLARWWGPAGFRNTFHEFEFKLGGNWRFDMHGPDGTDYPNYCVFKETSTERVVIRHLETVHEFTLTMALTPEAGGTRLDWIQVFDSAEEFAKLIKFVPRCNEENLDRLEAELARITAGDRELVIRRIIDASPDKLFRAWTEPELLKQWFAPLPYTTPVAELDVRAGGSSGIVMRGPDGTDLPHPSVYLEVVANERLVLTDAYTKAWEPSAKPFLTIVLTFEAVGERTRYTARCRHWTEADRDTHEKMGFYPGWNQCTDQLAALVVKL